MKVYVKSLGCKANFSDGQDIESQFLQQGWESTSDEKIADVIVVNSCTVTDEADRQSQREVRVFSKKNPRAKIVYTGCGAEVDPELSIKVPGLSYVVGNQNKSHLAELVSKQIQASKLIPTQGQTESDTAAVLGSLIPYGELKSRHPLDREWQESFQDFSDRRTGDSTRRTRGFLKIQEGCNSFCTYCIIPYGRGPSRSLPADRVIESVLRLVNQGFREVVLTGTNIGEYGIDLVSSDLKHRDLFDDLVERILKETSLERLRLSSLDPTEISDRLIHLMSSDKRLCPHFHVSLQHSETKVLRLMKRKYQTESVEERLNRIHQAIPGVFIGMDVIVGFPGESLADFESMKSRLSRLPWTRLHVFPYSERAGTPAVKLKEVVPFGDRKKRAQELNALGLDRWIQWSRDQYESGLAHAEFDDVLVECRVKGPDFSGLWWSGFTRNYQRVWFKADDQDYSNMRVKVRFREWFILRSQLEVVALGDVISLSEFSCSSDAFKNQMTVSASTPFFGGALL